MTRLTGCHDRERRRDNPPSSTPTYVSEWFLMFIHTKSQRTILDSIYGIRRFDEDGRDNTVPILKTSFFFADRATYLDTPRHSAIDTPSIFQDVDNRQ